MPVVVFFGAHADDVELGAGGTCAKLCDAGIEVHIVLATDEADAAVAAQRRDEQRAAALIMGVPAEQVHFLGLPDGDVRCTRKSVGMLRGKMAALGLSPAAVFVHTEADSHRDHVELSCIVRSTFRRLPIFHYAVRNSSVVTRFHPNVFSEIDVFVPLKEKALACHGSQVKAGRVPMDQVHAFARRFTLGIDGVSLEPFELEVQEGCVPDADILDLINDVPFSRLWLPLLWKAPVMLHDEPLTALAGLPRARAPWPMLQITRLHAELLKLSRGYGADTSLPVLEVIPPARQRVAWQSGTNLVFGHALQSSMADQVARLAPKARWMVEPSGDTPAGVVIRDRETHQRLSAPKRSARRLREELETDYGLLTMVRLPVVRSRTDDAADDTIVIAIAGLTEAGIAAACACLIEPEAITRIVAGARQVIEGKAPGMQWLVPCDLAGRPDVVGISGALTAGRTQRKDVARAEVVDADLCAVG